MRRWLYTRPAWGLVPVRLVAGLILFLAGYQKLVVVGLEGVEASFARMGIPLPEVAGPFVAVLELVGGAGLVLGAYTRWWAGLFAVEFTVISFVVKLPQGWPAMRLDLLLLAAALLLLIEGGGAASLDRAMAVEAEPGPPLEASVPRPRGIGVPQ